LPKETLAQVSFEQASLLLCVLVVLINFCTQFLKLETSHKLILLSHLYAIEAEALALCKFLIILGSYVHFQI
jgi:hypothetical protein